jgi:uncharacterized protein (DUF983 family)
MHHQPTTLKQNFWPVVGRALLGRCPNCGKGRLFLRYLKQVEYCEECAEAFGHIRADDGPAWLTILIVGHIIGPIMLAVLPGSNWPTWFSMTLWPSLVLILTVCILPRAKGLFIAIIWRLQCPGSEK